MVFQLLSIADAAVFKEQALTFAQQNFATVCYLDSNGYGNYPYNTESCLIAIGEKSTFSATDNAFEGLQKYVNAHKTWLFGFLTYDLKNEVEQLQSANFDGIGLPNLHFFEPQICLKIEQQQVQIFADTDATEIFERIKNTVVSCGYVAPKVHLTPRVSEKKYLETVQKIREHIIAGDIYELNFCQEFFATQAVLDPLAVFQALNARTKAPFAAFYKVQNTYLLCGSPERFLKKQGQKIISQPIKGTSRRSPDPEIDAQLRAALAKDEKNRAENVMIVDLVRNDLSRTCEAGTVAVEELFGIYTFEQVHQLISTVVARLPQGVSAIEVIKNAFPMGSMTGAPKVRSMQLIEEYEETKRGLFSGAVGYFSPEGDFDFNVVIRSLLYNAEQRYASLQVGGAIVYDSVPEEEYAECLLKARAIREVLQD